METRHARCAQSSRGLDPTPVKTVLIVEDDAYIAEVLLTLLQVATAYQVIHVFDGFAALKMVRTLLPHLVLLDYGLPGMDGLECLDLLRASKGMQQTPVILMSAAPPQNIQARTDLILLEKPFEMESLLPLHTCYLDGGLVPLFLLSTQIVASL